jgi:APA family basic amino acid/polyamine antiporter
MSPHSATNAAVNSGTTASGSLGLWTATALVTGNMIGSGIFLLPASLAGFGGISLYGWAFSTAGALTVALVFAGLSRQVRGSGGPYAYTRAAFGDLPAFLVGWGYWISMVAGNAAIAIALVGYMAPFFPGLVAEPLAATATALAMIWLLVAVNVAGIREAGRVQLVTTVLKLIPLVAIGLFGVAFLEPAHFEPWNLSGESDLAAITATAALTFWAFMGMECANIPADDVAEPEKTIPRAAVAGTLIAAAVYIPSTIGVMGVIAPEDLAGSTAPYADAAGVLFGSWAYFAVAAGAVIACFGALNGWTLCLGQIPMAAAKDNLFPAAFGKVSSRGTPAIGIVLSSLLVSVLVLMNYSAGLVEQFTFVILLATLSALLPYLMCALARIVLAFRQEEREKERGERGVSLSGLDLAVAGIAVLFAAWAIVGTGIEAILWGGILLLLGLPVYLMMRRSSRG